MNIQPFRKILSSVVPFPGENIDTDQIIPARFLKSMGREGFGQNLFCDWRYNTDGSPKPDFILNQKNLKGKILLAGHNFGCGSSREHAAWALYDYGFRVVISSFFADIFKSNALNNSLLPVQVEQGMLKKLFDQIQQNPSLEIEVDLEKQVWSIPSEGIIAKFEISAFKRTCLLNGFDDLDYVLNHKKQILEFENKRIHEKKYLSYTR